MDAPNSTSRDSPAMPQEGEHSVWRGLDHVQLAIPVGGEPVAREFYSEVLGMTEIPKPPRLAASGGAWFRAGPVEIHVGAEAQFTPARKAHPALLVDGLRDVVERLGPDVRWSDEIPGIDRCHLDDPFGNRIELIGARPRDGARGEDQRGDR